MENDLVSVIMPAYNAARYISDSIESVLKQSHKNLELIIVDDGSTDNTLPIIQKFNDRRIKYFTQINSGVAAARNRGLTEMKGNFFCFLDADDLMPENSLSSRLNVFKEKPHLTIVGGAQEQRNENLSELIVTQFPIYEGNPMRELARLNAECFINCGTWLIRKSPYETYQFPLGWTHSEDLAFFFSISEKALLGTTQEIAQIYRRVSSSAMSNLKGLENGYWQFYKLVKASNKIESSDLYYLKRRILRIMLLSYLRQFDLLNAMRLIINFARK
jgi:teichuronic acid biosynthesis glycosyltransferase TuaG